MVSVKVREAERRAKGKRSDEQPLDVMTRETVEPGLTMRSVQYAKGIVRLSEYYGIGGPSARFARWTDPPKLSLRWEGMNELDPDHGMSTICSILMDVDLWMLRPAKRDILLAEIKGLVTEEVWTRLSKMLREPRTDEGEEDLRDPIIIAFWAELFVEPLSDLWLAAMAQHAYYVDRNDFAFGYLTAQLDHRQITEEDYLRGRKSVLSGKAGAEARARSHQHTTKQVLAEMGRLIDDGHSISRAATITANGGIGTSSSANRKLWERHSNTPG